MKKVLAVFLAVLMAFSFVSMTVSARTDNNRENIIVDELLNGDYSHIDYVRNKNFFKTEIAVYTGLSLYDNALDNLFTGSVDISYAKAILLALIEQVEAEYKNGIFETIISILSTAKTGAQAVEKLDSFTKVLGLAENQAWANSLTAVNGVIKAMTIGDRLYKQYVEAYAVALSCQAAGQYYDQLLSYVAANVNDSNVKAAAKELSGYINKQLDEVTNDLILDLVESAVKEGISIAVNVALSSNTVTSIIRTIYKAIGSVADFLFNTKDKYLYMASLGMVVRIEEILPTYVKQVLANSEIEEDVPAEDFAISSLLIIRQTGESMLANLGRVTEDARVEKLIDAKNLQPTIEKAAIAATKLEAYAKVLKLDEYVHVYGAYTSIGNTKIAKLKSEDGRYLYTMPAGRDVDVYEVDREGNGYYALNAYSDAAQCYIQVIVSFTEGTTISYGTAASNNNNTTKKSGIAGIFQSIIDAIVNAFKSLFSFGK